jgi:hypothetical protein
MRSPFPCRSNSTSVMDCPIVYAADRHVHRRCLRKRCTKLSVSDMMLTMAASINAPFLSLRTQSHSRSGLHIPVIPRHVRPAPSSPSPHALLSFDAYTRTCTLTAVTGLRVWCNGPCLAPCMIRCGVGRRYVSAACFRRRGCHAMAIYNSPLTSPVQALKVGPSRACPSPQYVPRKVWHCDVTSVAACAGGRHGGHLRCARAPQRPALSGVSSSAVEPCIMCQHAATPWTRLKRCMTCRMNLLTAVGAAVLAASIWRFGAGNTALAGVLLATAVLSVLLHDMPTDNAGHRAGGRGYGNLHPQVPLLHKCT